MTAVIDVETDSTDRSKAKLKFLFAKDLDKNENICFDYTQKKEIKDFIKSQNILIGFNLKGYDNQVLENFGCDLKYKVIVDLYEALAPRGDNGFGSSNKDRLHDINPSLQLKNYKLKTFIETLGLDTEGKGEIDYKIFEKDEWTKEELEEIKKYGFQDIELEYKLFDWYRNIFSPLESYLNKKDVEKFKHLTCTSGVLAYKVLCNLSGSKEEYNDPEVSRELKRQSERIEGGHHIHARWEKVRGKIICRDFVSHYPTTLIQYNLLDKKLENAILKVLSERLKAKKEGNKSLALALKVPNNSFYGILGNPTFKNIYNPQSAKDCTRIGRELLKRYAKTLDVSGFVSLYGFTDSVYVGLQKLNEEDLDLVTKHFIESEKSKSPNPLDSFSLGIDGRYKFMWFIDLKDNNYLCVTDNNEVKIKGGLFDINTPKCIEILFEEYIKPKIVKDLDVNFTEEELLEQLSLILNKNPELAGEDYSVKELKEYNSKTSLQYQIADKYGQGRHSLIPNTAGIGIGRADLKYCTIEEFKENKLSVGDISISRMMKYLKPFYTTKEEVFDLEATK